MEISLSSQRLEHLNGWLKDLVDRGEVPHVALSVSSATQELHQFEHGFQSIAAQTPLVTDPLYRIYSMTKPVVSVALLRLFERGEIHLDQPLAEFLPAFADAAILTDVDDRSLPTRANPTAITLQHLFTHSSGLIYGLFEDNALGRAYRKAKVDFAHGDGPLSEVCDRLAELPLLFEPGTRWQYGVSTDVLGRVLEVATGKDLGGALHELIFEPLAMIDTGFSVPPSKADRLVGLYNRNDSGTLIEVDPAGPQSRWVEDGMPRCLSGGAGLVSSLNDYRSFATMLVNEGRGPDGAPLLSPATVHYARQNHLPGYVADMGVSRFSEMPMTGVGFGLGFGVIENPALARMHTSPGEFGWGGLASTVFWVDPVLKLSVLFMTQQIPSGALPLRPKLRAMLAAAQQ